jgi:hypothetical protein
VTELLFPDATYLEAALLSSEITLQEINQRKTNGISQNTMKLMAYHKIP